MVLYLGNFSYQEFHQKIAEKKFTHNFDEFNVNIL